MDLLTGLALVKWKEICLGQKHVPFFPWQKKHHHTLKNWMGEQTTYALWHITKPYSAKGPWNQSLNFIFPTKYVIPKSLKVGHCLWHKTVQNVFLFPSCPFLSFPTAAQGPKFRKKVIQKGATYLSYLTMPSNQMLGNEIEFSTQIPLEGQQFGGDTSSYFADLFMVSLHWWALNVRIKGFQAEEDDGGPALKLTFSAWKRRNIPGITCWLAD